MPPSRWAPGRRSGTRSWAAKRSERYAGELLRGLGKDLSADQRMDYYRDANHAVTKTVKDVASTAFASYVVRDGEHIALR